MEMVPSSHQNNHVGALSNWKRFDFQNIDDIGLMSWQQAVALTVLGKLYHKMFRMHFATSNCSVMPQDWIGWIPSLVSLGKLDDVDRFVCLDICISPGDKVSPRQKVLLVSINSNHLCCRHYPFIDQWSGVHHNCEVWLVRRRRNMILVVEPNAKNIRVWALPSS